MFQKNKLFKSKKEQIHNNLQNQISNIINKIMIKNFKKSNNNQKKYKKIMKL